MAHGKTLELQKIQGGTMRQYLAPGQFFRPTRRRVKQAKARALRARHNDRVEERRAQRKKVGQ